MITGNTSTYLTNLINAGQDAHQNLYVLRFYDNDQSESALTSALTVRADDITFPTISQATDSINYMTVSMNRPTANINVDKSISVSFRVDQNYEIYKYLLKKQKTTSIANIGFAGDYVTQAGNDSFNIKLYSLVGGLTSDPSSEDMSLDNTSSNSSYKLLYSFEYCWISSISGLSFSYSGSSAEKVTAKIYFWKEQDVGARLEEITR